MLINKYCKYFSKDSWKVSLVLNVQANQRTTSVSLHSMENSARFLTYTEHKPIFIFLNSYLTWMTDTAPKPWDKHKKVSHVKITRQPYVKFINKLRHPSCGLLSYTFKFHGVIIDLLNYKFKFNELVVDLLSYRFKFHGLVVDLLSNRFKIDCVNSRSAQL